jgi:lantibiotic biosynthesis protein
MSSDADHFLDVAAALGSQISESAIWHEGRCSWTGAATADPGGPRSHAALGPDLYGGTSGVALFLGEAAARLGDDRFRAVALGAIRHALRHAYDEDAEGHDGLYAGPIGIAYAAAYVGHRLGAEDALTGAHELLAAWRRFRIPSPASDVVSGSAGTVAGLVALAPLVEEQWIVEAAARVADELVARASASRFGLSWPAPGQRSMHHLCGFGHGAAGIGHALIELYVVTGYDRFREAGERAFDYECSWIRSDTGACPDLRGVARAAPRDAPLPAAGSWCYGAPGVALARIRAAQLLGDTRVEGELALAATRRSVHERLAYTPDDFCLCHGLSGAADVLLYSEVDSELAAEVGRHGIERHHRSATGFPCGLPEGESPALFAGLAGIGLFYLRLQDPAVRTPLLVGHLDPPTSQA